MIHSTLIDWLIFKGKQSLIGLLELAIALSKILLTVCSDQLLYNLNLIRLYLETAKQITAVKTASDACSMLVI